MLPHCVDTLTEITQPEKKIGGRKKKPLENTFLTENQREKKIKDKNNRKTN